MEQKLKEKIRENFQLKKENEQLRKKVIANNIAFISLKSTVTKSYNSNIQDFQNMLKILSNISESEQDTPERNSTTTKRTVTTKSRPAKKSRLQAVDEHEVDISDIQSEIGPRPTKAARKGRPALVDEDEEDISDIESEIGPRPTKAARKGRPALVDEDEEDISDIESEVGPQKTNTKLPNGGTTNQSSSSLDTIESKIEKNNENVNGQVDQLTLSDCSTSTKINEIPKATNNRKRTIERNGSSDDDIVINQMVSITKVKLRKSLKNRVLSSDSDSSNTAKKDEEKRSKAVVADENEKKEPNMIPRVLLRRLNLEPTKAPGKKATKDKNAKK